MKTLTIALFCILALFFSASSHAAETKVVAKTGGDPSATTQMKAAQQGDIGLPLVPWPAMETVAQSLGNLDGKIIIDVSMPFDQGEDGYPKKIYWKPQARK